MIDGAGIDISDGTFRQAGHGAFPTPDTRHPTPAWGVSATAALYRREALGATIFDANLFAYYEDVELNARFHESGWRTAVLPVIKATHRGSQSAPLLGSDALRLRTRNRYLVARRHRGVGRIGALLLEDVKLALRGRTSIRGVLQGLFTR
jgi:GT2 family glycosyltransferase